MDHLPIDRSTQQTMQETVIQASSDEGQPTKSRAGWTRRLLGTAAAVFLVGAATMESALAATCHTPAERQATYVRILQSELMVAALACRNETGITIVEDYNHFVLRFSSELSHQSKILQRYYQKAYGASYMRHFDRYVTVLANDASMRSRTPNYCLNKAGLAQAAVASDVNELRTLAAAMPESRAISLTGCGDIRTADATDSKAAPLTREARAE